MHNHIWQGIYNEGYRSDSGDDCPYTVSDEEAVKAWNRGHNDMLIDARAECAWRIIRNGLTRD